MWCMQFQGMGAKKHHLQPIATCRCHCAARLPNCRCNRCCCCRHRRRCRRPDREHRRMVRAVLDVLWCRPVGRVGTVATYRRSDSESRRRKRGSGRKERAGSRSRSCSCSRIGGDSCDGNSLEDLRGRRSVQMVEGLYVTSCEVGTNGTRCCEIGVRDWYEMLRRLVRDGAR